MVIPELKNPFEYTEAEKILTKKRLSIKAG